MSGNPGRQPGKPFVSEDADWRADHGGRRRHPGQCHAPVSRGLRRPDHQHDRGRRNRRYSRHHSAAPGHLRGKGRAPESRGQVGVDLSGRRRQHGGIDRGRAAEMGRAHFRQPVCRTGRGPAASHAHRHGTERFRADTSGGSSSWAASPLFFGIKQIRKHPHGPLLLRQDAAASCRSSGCCCARSRSAVSPGPWER